MLHGFGCVVDANCVRILRYPTTTAPKATLKVKDPLFAKILCDKLDSKDSTLHATIMSLDTKQSSWRKLHVSWHKPTRSVWLNFGKSDIALRVAKKFNDGSYMCLGHLVKSSPPKKSKPRIRSSSSPVAWTILLSNVPGNATPEDVKESITSMNDRPRHVELGTVSYYASELEVSVAIRSCLEKHGPLESFQLMPSLGRKRGSATVRYQDEADARSASELNNSRIKVLGNGKVTVALIQSVKVKVTTAVYSVSESLLERHLKTWKQQHLAFRVYTDAARPFTILKIEGSSAKDVAAACRALHKVLSGTVLVASGSNLWSPVLGSNGTAYKNLLNIAKDLGVVIIREKLKQQLRFHGPVNKISQATSRIWDILKEESSRSHEIDLNPSQFSWAIHGGFKIIQQALGNEITVFNVVSKRIGINGTSRQYDTALEIITSQPSSQIYDEIAVQSESEGDCPICFCEAENSIQCSCKHAYCLECFEGFCESAASTSQDEFRISCCGAEGKCSTIFTVKELRRHLPSSGFERVLERSFEEYVKRHPGEFHSCPTPDCDYIYRSSENENSKVRTHTCPSCFEQLCTSCHVHHGGYTCAEYKDIASGGTEALEKLKKELNIKDCPRCKTPMEKITGCNHMTCGGCRAHICWVCMDVFDTSNRCYEHMNKAHGGIGFELEAFMD